MISYFSWSRGFDPDDFMIYFPKTRDPVIPLTEIPWSGDLTHRNSMIRWSHSAKFHDPVISLTKIPWSGDLWVDFFVIHLVFNSES